jgi:hypothetical protein
MAVFSRLKTKPLWQDYDYDFLGTQHSGNTVSSTLLYLFVSEDEKYSIAKLIFRQHTHQLLASLADSLTIVAIDNEYHTCRQQKHCFVN